MDLDIDELFFEAARVRWTLSATTRRSDELIKTKGNFPVFQDWVESWEEIFPAGIRLSSLDSIGGEPISS